MEERMRAKKEREWNEGQKANGGFTLPDGGIVRTLE